MVTHVGTIDDLPSMVIDSIFGKQQSAPCWCGLFVPKRFLTFTLLCPQLRVVLVLPVAILDAIFILWIFTALSRTLSQLASRRQVKSRAPRSDAVIRSPAARIPPTRLQLPDDLAWLV